MSATPAKPIKEFNLIICGVGGQGNLLASEIVATAAVKAGYKSRVGETFGAAQRGGPVASYIRIGSDIYGPIVNPGSVSLIVAFEPMEALRNALRFLEPGGMVVMNSRPIIPLAVSMGKDKYPSVDEIVQMIKKTGAKDVVAFDAVAIAEKMGNPIVMNVVMVGALAGSGLLPFSADLIREAIRERIPSALLELNMKAFDEGYRASAKKS
jgi:indolepyruvate ferredoxin oxidoreductase beta subunit